MSDVEALTTQERIVEAMRSHRFTPGPFTVREIADAAGLSRSTVQNHLPALIKQRLVKHTSRIGEYAIERAAQRRR
jgi:DNA-binding IclR family transcriptional regulator